MNFIQAVQGQVLDRWPEFSEVVVELVKALHKHHKWIQACSDYTSVVDNVTYLVTVCVQPLAR